jgi:uncharacterized damage-inducible protein DinB
LTLSMPTGYWEGNYLWGLIMGERAETLAQRFEQANNDLIAAVDGLSDSQWQALNKDAGWSVGVTAHHVAVSHPAVAGLVQAIGSGQPLPPITLDMLNQGNAQHARESAGCTKQETLDLLRANGAAAAAVVRGLSDDQLDRTGTMPAFGDAPISAQQVIERILIGHPGMHLPGIRTATA